MPFAFSRRHAAVLASFSLLAACGGGGSSSAPAAAPAAPPAVVTHAVGGNVTGLTAGLVLQNNGSSDLKLMANGSYGFAAGLATGTSYNVTVRSNPPFQRCTVVNGTGVMGTSEVVNIDVTCVDGVVVSTVAGSTPGSQDGNVSIARFNTPLGVAADADGNLLITDTGNSSLRKITPAGDVTTLVTGLSRPFGVAVYQGRIFVTVETGNKLLEVHPVTYAVTEVPLDTALDGPRGLVADTAGNLYVAESAQRIRKISIAGGTVTTLAGTGVQGSTNGPGTSATFAYPAHLAIDDAGNIYVADQSNQRIRKVTPTGDVTTLAGTGIGGTNDGPGATATFYEPVGMAVGGDGMLYMSDSAGQKIRRVAPDGTVSTVAGVGLASGTADGSASTARFDYPAGIAFDAQGNLYTTESNSNRIRKLSSH